MITVSIIDDDVELCQKLMALLNDHEDFICTHAYHDCETAIKQLAKSPPDVILLDIGFPGMRGTEAVTKLKEILPHTEILMLTMYDDHDNLFESLKNGASGYLLKGLSLDELLNAIREVYNDGTPLSMKVARKMVAHFREYQKINELTEREKEVLFLLSEGKSQKMVSDSLNIAVATVKFRSKNIMQKLHASNITHAVKKAMKGGMIE